MAGGETIISTIGSNPRGEWVSREMQDIFHVLSEVLTVLVQRHHLTVFGCVDSSVGE